MDLFTFSKKFDADEVAFAKELSSYRECVAVQCVAVCCSVLQCVTVCCSVLQCVAACCSVSFHEMQGSFHEIQGFSFAKKNVYQFYP